MTCKHEFSCHIGIAVFEDKPGCGSAEISGRCIHCGVPLVFQGPRGIGNSPMASVDRTELRAPVTFGYEPRFVPGPEMKVNGPELQKDRVQ